MSIFVFFAFTNGEKEIEMNTYVTCVDQGHPFSQNHFFGVTARSEANNMQGVLGAVAPSLLSRVGKSRRAQVCAGTSQQHILLFVVVNIFLTLFRVLF